MPGSCFAHPIDVTVRCTHAERYTRTHSRAGVDAAAGEREIARAKVRLQTQRDLDGIDSSNIITGGRQRRGGGAPVSYKAMIELPSDSEEEDEEESASEDDEQQSGSDAEAGGCAG